jgi:uncharacterized protein
MEKLVWLATVVLCLGQFQRVSAQERSHPLVPSITVVGSDEVSAKPDMAEIQVGVVTQAQAAVKAVNDNTEAMQKLFKALGTRGIKDKDLQTSNFSVSPQYRHGPRGEQLPEIAGYQVNNDLRIKVRKLDQLGEILDELVNQGANNVHGISFSVAEPRPLQDEARKKALADARRKAELYAGAAGVKVGRVLLIEE